jgi:hypothetical protein
MEGILHQPRGNESVERPGSAERNEHCCTPLGLT